MRIGIDLRTLDAPTPGQQRYLWRLGHWLQGRGHEVVFTTVRPVAGAQAEAAPWVGDGSEAQAVARVGAGGRSGRAPHDEAPQVVSLGGLTPGGLAQRVRALELDVLLLNPERSRHYRAVRPNLLRSAYGTEQYRQKLRSFRGHEERALRELWRRNPWLQRQQRWERNFYEDRSTGPLVVAQSAYMRREILDSYGIDPSQVEVVHNAVDLQCFNAEARTARRAAGVRETLAVPADSFCLLFIGHNYRLKGLWQVLQQVANARAAGAPIHLLVAGRGTGSGQRRHAERLMRQLGLEAHVTRVGSVTNPLDLYAAADGLMHLSWHDSFGFVVLEAMACGVPVITTPWAGASELIESGRTGFVADPGDKAAVAQALAELVAPGLAAPMGQRAAAAVRRCDEPNNFARIEALMQRAAHVPVEFR